MGQVKIKAGSIGRCHKPPAERIRKTENNPEIHNPAEQESPDKTEDQQPGPFLHPPGIAQPACRKSGHSPGEHLPWCPGALTEVDIRDQRRHCTDDEPCLCPKDISRQNDNGRYGLDTWQCGKGIRLTAAIADNTASSTSSRDASWRRSRRRNSGSSAASSSSRLSSI